MSKNLFTWFMNDPNGDVHIGDLRGKSIIMQFQDRVSKILLCQDYKNGAVAEILKPKTLSMISPVFRNKNSEMSQMNAISIPHYKRYMKKLKNQAIL